MTDMIALLGTLFGSRPSPQCLDRLDADDDGAVTLSDAVYIGRSLYGRGPAIPPPFPVPGADPTPDALACPGS